MVLLRYHLCHVQGSDKVIYLLHDKTRIVATVFQVQSSQRDKLYPIYIQIFIRVAPVRYVDVMDTLSPFHSPLLRDSQLFSYPFTNMLKSEGISVASHVETLVY